MATMHESRQPDGQPQLPHSPSQSFETVKTLKTVCLVGDKMRNNRDLLDALESCPLNIEYASALPIKGDPVERLVDIYVVDDFADVPEMDEGARLLGPGAAKALALKGNLLERPETERPLFCLAMDGLGVCFGRLGGRDAVRRVRRAFHLVRWMGGSVIKDLHSKRVTHVVADTCLESCHRYASTFGIPAVTVDWILDAWDRRHETGFAASDDAFVADHRIKPFQGLNLAFLGFPPEEKAHMAEELLRNGGRELPPTDERLTHLVVDASSVAALPDDLEVEVRAKYVLKGDWFWASIQMVACADENLYLFRSVSREATCHTMSESFHHHFNSVGCSSGSKRDRRKAAVQHLAADDDPLPVSETFQHLEDKSLSVSRLDSFFFGGHVLSHPSSDSLFEDNFLSLSQASMTKSATSPKHFSRTRSIGWLKAASGDSKGMTPRQQVFHELLQTEINYTNILKTILEVFKAPLEDPNIIGGQILNQTEIKLIFGNFQPIYDVHERMLYEFWSVAKTWNSHSSIGDIFLRHGDSILKAYLPYINFLESSKAHLIEKDRINPRFHAFLKRCESNPNCGRQSLDELMIRPVQRLPSVQLLLTDILKHSKREKGRADVVAIEKALEKIKETLIAINQNKRRTDAQVQLFTLFNEIENCPPYLVSSHRSFVRSIEVTELGGSDELCGRGCNLNLLLFSDVLEVSKKKQSGRSLGLRSPNIRTSAQISLTPGNIGPCNLTPVTSNSAWKHVKMIPLSSVKRVVDVKVSGFETQENIFGLVCRSNQELKEKMYLFQLSKRASERASKCVILGQICRLTANVMYRSDADSYLRTMTTDDLGIDHSEFNPESFGIRAYKSIHKRVNRALSFDRTPTGERLKRAFSSVISPSGATIVKNDFLTSATIGGSLETRRKKLRLASCGDLLGGGASPLLKKTRSTFSVGNYIDESPSNLLASHQVSKPTLTPGALFDSTSGKPVRRPSLKMKAAALLRSAKKKSQTTMSDRILRQKDPII